MSAPAQQANARLDVRSMRRRLLAWYTRNRRDLPWRAAPGTRPDPYVVWLSEIMLQQTTVATVIPYFREFLRRWPDVQALAGAETDAVLHAWQGLGYYARARNMLECARLVAGELGGRFPDQEHALARLPGIGAYTAAAVAAIAYGRPALAVDGNVKRVLARVFALTEEPAALSRRIATLAADLPPRRRAGDFAQGMMDLGATLCTPRRPDCGGCPWSAACAAHLTGRVEDFPRRAAAKPRPTRHGIVFWTRRADGAVLLRRRQPHGLLGGLMEFPSTEWRERAWTEAEALPLAPIEGRWRPLPGIIRHTFTHFHLELTVLAGDSDGANGAAGVWCDVERLGDHALPTVMKKVARHALAHSPSRRAGGRAAPHSS